MIRKRIRFAWLIPAMLGVAYTAGAAEPIQGYIYRKGASEPIAGMILWQEGSKQYLVKRGGAVIPIPLRDVADVKVPRPAELARAARDVYRGQRLDQAMGVLETLRRKYKRMQHDVEATGWLAEAHLKKGDPRKARTLCEGIIRSDEDRAYRGRLASVYADALLATKEYRKLRGVLDKVIKHGQREGAAIAQVKRGDIYKQQGDAEKALREGYLRTVVLFKGVKSVRPEALFKAAKAFDELGEQPYAEKMRKLLLEEFPNDPYSEKVKLGM